MFKRDLTEDREADNKDTCNRLPRVPSAIASGLEIHIVANIWWASCIPDQRKISGCDATNAVRTTQTADGGLFPRLEIAALITTYIDL